jgi:hypothetical protein
MSESPYRTASCVQESEHATKVREELQKAQIARKTLGELQLQRNSESIEKYNKAQALKEEKRLLKGRANLQKALKRVLHNVQTELHESSSFNLNYKPHWWSIFPVVFETNGSSDVLFLEAKEALEQLGLMAENTWSSEVCKNYYIKVIQKDGL